jgi:hypothetical protein
MQALPECRAILDALADAAVVRANAIAALGVHRASKAVDPHEVVCTRWARVRVPATLIRCDSRCVQVPQARADDAVGEDDDELHLTVSQSEVDTLVNAPSWQALLLQRQVLR